MGWTDSDKVRNRLLVQDLPRTTWRDMPVDIDSAGSGLLPHRGLTAASEKVKLPHSLSPTAQAAVTLNGEAWAQLNHSQLRPGSVVVAADETLEVVYLEGLDYAVDAASGKLRRIASGAIGDGAAVQVYYQRYQILQRDVDYEIDAAEGRILTLPGGALKSDARAWVDYELNAGAGADLLIPDAVATAEDIITASLRDGYDATSTDTGLVSGATELAAAIVCRGLAARALADGAASAEGRSRGWRKLGEEFAQAAYTALKPFLSGARLTAGSRRANQSWLWE